ncbi:MAG: hypothetical protein JO142_02110 [Burkholderiales bacterium]|nr:hypothetical protein [Burkholderiales bacterium]
MSLEVALAENTKALNAHREATLQMIALLQRLGGKPLNAAEAERALFNQHGTDTTARAEAKPNAKPEPEKALAKVEEPPTDELKDETPEADTPEVLEALFKDQIAPLVRQHSTGGKRQAVIDLCARYGVQKASGLLPEQYREFLAELQAI